MLFYANGIDNRAVWNAMQLHARILIQAGEEITFIVHSDNIELIKRQFPTHTLYSFKSTIELFKIILNSGEHKIFVPDFFAVLTISPIKLFKTITPYYWIQGAVPEESYMRHHMLWRKKILSILEYIALRMSKYQIIVSPYMKTFLEQKHELDLNAIIVPCTSDLIQTTNTKTPDSFTYVGGMSAWQRFDIMLEMFQKILAFKPSAHFYVATGELEKVIELINLHIPPENHSKISVRSINDRKTMQDFLNTMEYGFLIRDDDPVNNVSSPIKLAEYLSCGVNVIISNAVTSYAPLVQSYGAGINIETVEDIDALRTFIPSADAALNLYREQFGESKLVDAYRGIL